MDYKEAVDAITAWADGRDRQAYEKAMEEIPDKPDRAEIVERYTELVYPTCLTGRKRIRQILSDFYEEVRRGQS